MWRGFRSARGPRQDGHPIPREDPGGALRGAVPPFDVGGDLEVGASANGRHVSWIWIRFFIFVGVGTVYVEDVTLLHRHSPHGPLRWVHRSCDCHLHAWMFSPLEGSTSAWSKNYAILAAYVHNAGSGRAQAAASIQCSEWFLRQMQRFQW